MAGVFYPAEPAVLARQVRGFLEAAEVTAPDAPKAVIVPHAGYVYSGPVAGSAFAALRSVRDVVQRIIG